MQLTFKGGIHVPEYKNTSGCAIEKMPAGEYVSVPLSQHIGVPAKALVQKGDNVTVGQTIGKFDDGLSCPVHSPVSGTVEEIQLRNSYNGAGKTEFIVIKNDFKDTLCSDVVPCKIPENELTAEDIIQIVKNAGISGMGGASFPTHAKISSAKGKAHTVIINCAECEPFITANHRLMLEDPDSILKGASLILKALGLEKAIFAVEDNKKDAAMVMKGLTLNDDRFDVKILKTKYPQGDERQIIKAIEKVELKPGSLPADAGYVIFNAETCSAIYYAYSLGTPLVKRTVTVDGDCITTPKNIRVPIGTSFAEIVEFCGGLKCAPSKIISGGPMMGMAQWDINSVVTKGTSAILFLSDAYSQKRASGCIHCGKCVSACPMHLMPNYLAMFSKNDKLDMCEEYNVLSCVECGCCTFTCPADIPIVQHIRVAKGKVQEKRKKLAARKTNN